MNAHILNVEKTRLTTTLKALDNNGRGFISSLLIRRRGKDFDKNEPINLLDILKETGLEFTLESMQVTLEDSKSIRRMIAFDLIESALDNYKTEAVNEAMRFIKDLGNNDRNQAKEIELKLNKIRQQPFVSAIICAVKIAYADNIDALNYVASNLQDDAQEQKDGDELKILAIELEKEKQIEIIKKYLK